MGRAREVPAFGPWVFNQGKELSDPMPHKLGPLIRDALESLDVEDRDLLFMRFYERLTYEAIAARWGFDDARGHRQRMWYYVTRALERLEAKLTELARGDDATYLEAISEDA